MSERLELEDLQVKRGKDDKILPEYKEIEFNGQQLEVGIKDLTAADVNEIQALGEAEEASTQELLDIAKKIIVDPDLASVSDEELQAQYSFISIRNILKEVVQTILGDQMEDDIKNLKEKQLS